MTETTTRQSAAGVWEERARLFALASDPTRLRILAHLLTARRACVSDIAQALGCSVACISHHLQLLRESGLLAAEREGNTICYAVVRTPFTRQLGTFLKKKGRASR
jgi:DNA-binding transcriptional ArsR family regulator